MISASKLIYVFAIALTISAIACKNKKTPQQSTVEQKSTATTFTKKDYDTLITTPGALVLYPTDHQIDSMKKKDGEDFYTGADDYQFYLANCRQYLDSVKLKTIVKHASGVVAFKTQSNQLYKFRLDTLSWNLILFNGKAKPNRADITDIEGEYKKYMK